MSGPGPTLTIVIPALNEAGTLPDLLADLAPLDAEVIVADGGSSDQTRSVASGAGASVVTSPRGRGLQMRTGAGASRSDWLLFLHADSRIGAEALDAVTDHVATASQRAFAHFGFAFEGGGPLHRIIEVGQRARERCFGLIYGDQGLLVSRALYDEVDGFPEWSIMEDVGLVDRLRRAGRSVRLDARLRTSPRRYDAEGVVRAWLRNSALITAFRAGVAPSTLERWYRPRDSASSSERGVIVFAKAPVAGRVKTRLAASIGDAEAVRIYRRLAEDTVSALRHRSWRLYVYADPGSDDDGERASSLDVVREWLGPDGIEYRLQAPGDLGVRMSTAFADCFAECAEVCIVGTDLPGMDAAWITESFDRLGPADVVLGPATDGGYYLMALRGPSPDLFRDVEWSTADVLPTTLARAKAAGMRVVKLPLRTDVDTVRDVPKELLSH